MSEKMLKFVKIGQQTPPKRDVKNRKDDFGEIYGEFINKRPKSNPAGVLNASAFLSNSLSSE